MAELTTYLAGRERGDSLARWDKLVPAFQALAAALAAQGRATRWFDGGTVQPQDRRHDEPYIAYDG
jgi:hypothetical protein